MKKYILTQPKEQGTYFRGDNIFTQIYIKDVITNALVDPSDVSIAIIDPCGSSVTDDAMTKIGVGIYTFDYDIPSAPTDSPYGIYQIRINTHTKDTLTLFNFVLFPWDVVSRIRELSGFYQQNDISDYKLAMIAWNSYMETLDDIYELHTNERPHGSPSNCDYINGSNIYFQVRNAPIADSNGDEYITGFGELVCGEDVTATYIDEYGVMQYCNVTVLDANSGLISITQLSGAAIPLDSRSLKVTYSTQSETYNEGLMREAVAYLSAHKALVSFQSLGKATLADLSSNDTRLRIDHIRFLKRYEDIVEEIGFPMIGSGK